MTKSARRATPEGRVYVATTRIGRGLFAAKGVRRGRDIMKISGRIVSADELWDVGGSFADNCYRFGPETYLDPGDSPARFVNHSCEPNVGVRKENNQLFLFAARDIRPHEELFFDYSTLLGDDDIWTMRCRCGTPACRSRVRKIGSLPTAQRERYLADGLVPKYIVRTFGWTP